MARKPKYQLFGKLRKEEYAALEADILKRGVQVAVELDEDGEVLDGHHRKEIADRLGKSYKTVTRKFKTEEEKKEHVIKLNMARRQMEPHEWGGAFKMLLKERGVERGSGATNRHTSTGATVALVAEELGVPERTAKHRMKASDDYDALNAAEKTAVRDREKTISQAKRQREKEIEQAELDAKNKTAKATAKKAGKSEPDIRHGDCLIELPKIKKPVRLIFADPPYNIGVDYGKGKKADSLSADDYLIWCQKWINLCVNTLTDDGSMWVMINDEWADQFGVMLTDAGLHRRAWIKWYETFGVNCKNNFNRTSRHIFYYVTNPKKFVFHADAVNRQSDRQTKYNDKRADPGGKIWDDVWQIPRLTGTCDERLPEFPTQVPLAITRAIIGCASDPGDLVLDPFNGSGSTGVAALENNRRYIGIEKEKKFCDLARARLTGI